MRKAKTRREILTFFTILFLAVLVLCFQGTLRTAFYTFSQPLEEYFFQAGERSSNFFKGLFFFCEIKKENQFLKEENKELLSRIVELEDLRTENKELRSALDLKLEEKFLLQQAKAILYNTEEDFILINKGREDGLAKDLAVIDFNNVLVGRILEVYKSTSKVMLISNEDIKFSVELEGKRINGLLKGIGNGRVVLDLIPKEEELNPGALISTAGFEGNFPQGLLVGKIEEVEKTDLAPFQKASVDVLFNFKNSNNLLVILENELD